MAQKGLYEMARMVCLILVGGFGWIFVMIIFGLLIHLVWFLFEFALLKLGMELDPDDGSFFLSIYNDYKNRKNSL